MGRAGRRGELAREVEATGIRDPGTILRAWGVPAFEVVPLSGRVASKGAERVIAITPYFFHPGEEPVRVEGGLRFDVADQDLRPLHAFGVSVELAIAAIAKVNRPGEEMPIPAVAVKPDGAPSERAELKLTVSLMQVAEEPETEPAICFSLAHPDRAPVCRLGMSWSHTVIAVDSVRRHLEIRR